MSYVVPSPLVYQELQNAGGVLNSTPDLDACIIGPAYNVLRYTAGSIASLIKTAATLVTTPLSVTIAAGSNTITFATAPAVTVGDVLLISGAGASGATLQATVLTVVGLVVTLDTAAITSVTNAVTLKKGSLTNNTISNAFNLPSQLPGQTVDATSIAVYLNNAKVQTLYTNFHGFTGSNVLNMVAVTGTCNTTVGSFTVTNVTTSGKFVIGDVITIAGAGAAGAAYVGKIAAFPVAGSITLDQNYNATAPATAVTAGAISKNSINNISPTTSTLVLEPGDGVYITYTNNLGNAATFSSSVSSVVSATGTISQISLADVLPSDISRTTVVTVLAASGTNSITVGSVTGVSIGDEVKLVALNGVGNDFVTTITGIAGNVLTLANNLTASAAINTVVDYGNQITVGSRKVYNNQLMPVHKISAPASLNYDTSTVGTNGEFTIEPFPELIYGVVESADVYVAYRALRTDLSGQVNEVVSTVDIEGQFGDISDQNPLALALQLAAANTTTRIKYISVASNDLTGFQAAFDLAQGQRLYALVPLTQDQSIIAALKNHVLQMSVPQMAGWRVALVNTAIPTSQNIGPYSSSYLNANSGNNTIALSAGQYVLNASNATFMSDGVTAGDTVYVYNGTTQTGSYTVQTVVSNQQLVINATAAASGISYYVSRALTKAQKAASVAAVSTSFGSSRVIHIQPDTVGVTVNGTTMYLPGYYLCAATAGLIAGFPVQQGFTNIGVAGIADLKFSNFYFTRAQLDTMAQAGTFLFVQETQGSIPYCRHELTTDVSVLQYRELLVVKNWDFLSYFYYDKLKSFMGSWNITQETLNTVRRTIDASSELLKSQKLPKIGAPLIDATVTSLAQDTANLDTVNCTMSISVVYPFNYINLYLVI